MRSAVKYPTWLPRPLRPTPRPLADARDFARSALAEKWDAAHDLAGWLNPDDAVTLCHLAHLCPPGPIVEIGSFKGKSTVFLAAGMKPSNTLTAMDPHVMATAGNRRDRKREAEAPSHVVADESGSSWEAFSRTLADWNLVNRITVVRDFSYNLRPKWTQPIAFLWIDGDHSYDAVKRDIEDWVDLVVPGGYLAFHDTHPKRRNKPGGYVRTAIEDTGVTTRRGFATHLELRNAWFLRRSAPPVNG